MSRRLVRWPLALYPRAWRNRYGAEVADLTYELVGGGETTALRAALNLIAGAAVERRRTLIASAGAALASAAAAAITATGVVLAVDRGPHGGGARLPYFDTHAIGALLLIVVVIWFVMETLGLLQVPSARAEVVGGPSPQGAWSPRTHGSIWLHQSFRPPPSSPAL
jgi:hypothetical protein